MVLKGAQWQGEYERENVISVGNKSVYFMYIYERTEGRQTPTHIGPQVFVLLTRQSNPIQSNTNGWWVHTLLVKVFNYIYSLYIHSYLIYFFHWKILNTSICSDESMRLLIKSFYEWNKKFSLILNEWIQNSPS